MATKQIRLIKRLDRYILGNFIPLLLVTFPICWFVVVMQFLWRYTEELVGKGLSVGFIMETLFYIAMTMVPMALPLGILLAALMTFGNLGERLELLSMKAAGMPLYRIMQPLFVLVCAIAVGLFIFQNDFMIKSQVKMWTMILSARDKSPELEIPEGSFYNAVHGYNIFVKKKDYKSGRLEDILIYDYSKGIKDVRIIRADSGRIAMNSEKDYIVWKLYGGQSFENIAETPPSYSYNSDPISHIKEYFHYKEIFIPFDASFKTQSAESFEGLYISKNLSQLTHSLDSAERGLDSIRQLNEEGLRLIAETQRYTPKLQQIPREDAQARAEHLALDKPIKVDLQALTHPKTLEDSLAQLVTAISQMELMVGSIRERSYNDEEYFYSYRTMGQERHRKFTFPVACIVFFFIGAPLGAIIRKGGIGMPMIACVGLFIVYYILEMFGYRMASNGQIPIWLGSWISVLFLLPLGIFLTYTATRDSASLNLEAYGVFFRKLLGTSAVRKVEYKELVIANTPPELLHQGAEGLLQEAVALRQHRGVAGNILMLWLMGSPDAQLKPLSLHLEEWVSEATNTDNELLLAKLGDLPYLPEGFSPLIPTNRWAAILLLLLLPISIPITLVTYWRRKQVKGSLDQLIRELEEAMEILARGETTRQKARN